MSGFFYWFEAGGGGLQLLREAGLTDRFDGAEPTQTLVGHELGPDGRPGIVFHAHPAHELPREIQWYDLSGVGLPWRVGHTRGAPPTAQELRNGEQPVGTVLSIKLLDWERTRQAWLFPRVLPAAVGRSHGLPTVYALLAPGEDGRDAPAEQIRPRYRPLVEQAGRYVQAMEDGGRPDMFRYAAALLGVYQRIGWPECLALGLLDPLRCWLMTAESIDYAERIRARLGPAGEALAGREIPAEELLAEH